MPISNFPQGFSAGVSIRGVPLLSAYPGDVYWVHSGTGSNGNNGTFGQPWATVDYAIGRCTAGAGDIIMIKPGHAENIATASAITSDVSGVAIVGLGTGALTPSFSWTATDATWVVSAANQSFINLRFKANIADVVIGFDVSGVDGLSWQNCTFADNSTILNFIDVIDLATGADDISVVDCAFFGKAAANDACISGVAHDKVYIANCQFHCETAQTAAHGLIVSSGNITNLWIRDCAFSSQVDGAVFIDLDGTTNTGLVTNCYFSSIDGAGAVTAGFDMTGVHAFECYVAGEADSYGIVGGGTAYNNA
jgi:hypothetical protein